MNLIPPVDDGDHILSKNGLIELLEYGDFQCPYCGRAFHVVKRLKYESGNHLKFIFRNFPLKKIHPQAKSAAIAAEAAGLQNKFWEMHDLLFENQKHLNSAALIQYASSIDLDIDQFKNDMQSNHLSRRVDDDFMSGLRSGVNATPTFFINGIRYQGSWEYIPFFAHLNTLIQILTRRNP